MDRISRKNLEALAQTINRELGRPQVTWRKEGERWVSNPGNFHLSGAYGGVSLHEICNESGGVHDVFSCGHQPKRDVYDRMQAFLAGLRHAKEQCK